MKSIKEYLTESFNNVCEADISRKKTIKILPSNMDFEISKDLIDILDGDMTFYEWIDDHYDGENSDYPDACNVIDDFIHRVFKKGGVVNMGYQFEPDDTDDLGNDDNAWVDFYQQAHLKRTDHGIILLTEGDDYEYTYLVFKKVPTGKDRAILDDFLTILKSNEYQHVACKF